MSKNIVILGGGGRAGYGPALGRPVAREAPDHPRGSPGPAPLQPGLPLGHDGLAQTGGDGPEPCGAGPVWRGVHAGPGGGDRPRGEGGPHFGRKGSVRSSCRLLGADVVPEALPGLAEAAHTPYTLEGAEKLGGALVGFKGGRVVVMVSSIPFKCPAAPV